VLYFFNTKEKFQTLATPAQINANRLNAQLSTGPRTPEGKAAVAQNRTAHGLTGRFAVLPCEDADAWTQLLAGYIDEYRPVTPTEHFLVTELAQAQWRLLRAGAIEAELLNPGESPTYADIVSTFRDSDALNRLGRYAQAARRAYYKALETLEGLRRATANRSIRARREQTRDFERRVAAYIEAPLPGAAAPKLAFVKEPVMPEHLGRELDTHRRRDPDFDPRLDASQMSKELRKWFEKHGEAPAWRICDSKPINPQIQNKTSKCRSWSARSW
jgi:hypothetical protein